MRSTNKPGDSGLRNPITGTAGCARTTSGQSDAEPTRPLMKSRLRTQSPTNDRLSFYKSYQMSVVRFGSKADMCAALAYVRSTPKADMCGATRDVHFGPIADIPRLIR